MTDALEYNPPKPIGSLILLHGLGSNGADLHPLAQQLAGGRLRVISPTAPTRAITVNGGWQMPAWYDIVGADLASRQDAVGAREATAFIENLLAVEKSRGVESHRLFLAGFSQGAAISLYAGLRHTESLGGVAALSGYLLLEKTLEKDAAAANRKLPIFQAHGTLDPVVLPKWATQCRDWLIAGGWPITYKEYPIAHAISSEELQDLNEWLNIRLLD
ncbi:alpha/beta fold hydrolase [Candidatus Persebacteraceae bacterium Df01]|uniref:Alpha/beta fold hydrolase n=1 Tax=Candidatus Doriopsillibacter californiensis TaxID=2970740 RepID=A0ABT7QJP2_9GAMM|nr:alpha/beta fold hydrolase [Candidatus Persebacteraceae bacterium Df01]